MSRLSTLVRSLRFCVRTAAEVDLEALVARMEEWAGTVKATTYDRPTVAGGSIPDPTGRLASDEVWADRRRLDHVMRDLVTAAAQLRDLHVKYLGENRARADADAGDPGCQSCARLKLPDGRRRWEPTLASGTVKGRLAEPMRLCRWCYEWVRARVPEGVAADRGAALPTRQALDQHHAGKRIAVS